MSERNNTNTILYRNWVKVVSKHNLLLRKTTYIKLEDIVLLLVVHPWVGLLAGLAVGTDGSAEMPQRSAIEGLALWALDPTCTLIKLSA